MTGTPTAPLAGVRVLDLGKYFPVPLCAQVLADLGAEVIKLEPPGVGDPVRVTPPLAGHTGAAFLALNRGKRSIAIDLKTPGGLEAARRLVTKADVVIDGNRPGVLARLGLDPAVLREQRPELIWLTLTGYGREGARRDLPGHDINYQALAGSAAATGTAERPVMPGVQWADAFGALWGLVGVLAALAGRARDGRGRDLDVALADSVLPALTLEFAQAWSGAPPREGGMLTGALPGYRLYETADGAWLSVGALEPKFWARLCAALGRSDLEPRWADPSAVGELAEVFRVKPLAAWETVFAEHPECCVAPVRDLRAAAGDPELKRRGAILDIGIPGGGSFAAPGTPIVIGGRPARAPHKAPALGQHTDEVLRELAYTKDEIAALRRNGAVD